MWSQLCAIILSVPDDVVSHKDRHHVATVVVTVKYVDLYSLILTREELKIMIVTEANITDLNTMSYV